LSQPVLQPDAELEQLRLQAFAAYRSFFHLEREACKSAVSAELLKRYDEGDVLHEEGAAEALHSMARVLYRRAYEVNGCMPRWQWLRTLRYLPSEAFGGGQFLYEGSYQERRRIVEALSGVRALDGPNPKQVCEEAVFRLVAAGTGVANAAVLLRMTSKGAGLRIRRAHYPEIDSDSDLVAAIKLFDERMDGDLNLVAGTVAHGTPLREQHSVLDMLLWTHRPVQPFNDFIASREQLAWRTFAITDWGFAPIHQHFRLPGAMTTLNWYHEELPGLLVLNSAIMLFLILAGDNAVVSAMRYGYIALPYKELEQFLDLALSRFADELIQLFGRDVRRTLSAATSLSIAWRKPDFIKPGLIPYVSGPILRKHSNGVALVDLVAATHRVALRCRVVASAGPALKARGDDFEEQVRRMVGHSPCGPRPESVSLPVGVPIRAGGRALTDVDALAYRDGVAFLIDAKAIAPVGFAEGLFAPTRNHRAAVEREAHEWPKKVAELQSHGCFERYGLDQCREVVSIVVTPGAPWVTSEHALAWAHPGIRRVASYEELKKFLDLDLHS